MSGLASIRHYERYPCPGDQAARHRELIEAQNEAYTAHLRASLDDLKAGRVRRGTADDLIRELDLEG